MWTDRTADVRVQGILLLIEAAGILGDPIRPNSFFMERVATSCGAKAGSRRAGGAGGAGGGGRFAVDSSGV